MKYKHATGKGLLQRGSGAILMALATAVTAGGVPQSHIASPEVYKVLAEDQQMRVIRATWQPGQRDAMHSHPRLAAYSLTDCRFRIYRADGSSVVKSFRANDGARVKGPTKKHSFENISEQPCQTLLVEIKP